MTAEQTTLARQLAALPGFRWDRGMSAFAPGDVGTVVTVYWNDADKDGQPCGQMSSVYVSYDEETRACEHPDHDLHMLTPNLTDNATGGVLLGWLAGMGLLPTADCDASRTWDVGFGEPGTWGWTGSCSTLAEACARALVAIGRCA